MTILLLSRDPEPGETGVPSGTEIALQIATTSAAGTIDDANTQIYIQSVLAYDAGAFQAGFNGANSSSAATFAGTRDINVHLSASFSSEETVTVRVVSQDGAATEFLDESYSFEIEDLTAPRLLSAIATDPKTIRVTFNEAVRNSDATAADDATNPINYTFSRLTPSASGLMIPAVNVEPTSVTKITDLIYDISADIELSFAMDYSVSAANVEDTNGNAVAAPYDLVEFAAFSHLVAGRNLTLEEIVPRINIREDVTGDLRRTLRIFQDVVNIALYDIDKWTDILDPDIASEKYVNAMLCDLGNPFDFDLSLTDKRRLIRVLVQIYRQKGLAVGIQNAVLFFLGLIVTVQYCSIDSWIIGESELGVTTTLAPGGQAALYSFEIVSLIVLTDDQRSQITAIAEYMKPAHTHLKRFSEPIVAPAIDHWEIGKSELGETTILHI